MQKLIGLVLAVLLLETGLGAQAPRIRDYPIVIPPEVIQETNDEVKSTGYQLLSIEAHNRLKDGKSSSYFGRLVTRCPTGREFAMKFVFTDKLVTLPEGYHRELYIQSFRPIATLDHGVAFLSSSEVAQGKLALLVFSIVAEGCHNPSNSPEPFVAFSLWLSRDEKESFLADSIVSAARFEELK